MESGHLILLKCGTRNYAINAQYVKEILKIEYLQKVPGCHEYIAGVTIHRGMLIPIYFIDLEQAGRNKLFYAIILYRRERYIGFICEEVGIYPLEKAKQIDDKNLIKNYNSKDNIESFLAIDNEIYGLIEYKRIDRIYYENNKGGMNESEDINSG